MTSLFRDHPRLAALNGGSLADPRVQIVNVDAWRWLEERAGSTPAQPFDAAIMDLPDPSNYALGRIYSAPFFRLLSRQIASHGLIVTQATSPVAVREAFWCIVATLEAAGLHTAPYHAVVPSFGDWGFAIASRDGYRPPARLPEGLSFLTPEVLRTLFSYYDRGWRRRRE